ncbi:sigma-E factor regulatory protein RseB domain-containing protein [Jiangella sp. DSM 45060]|uniref:sigma-E factor regulatory protein RseB domain-containing protein n=1 Tax=Jiangella sp. DSM 45060 TaxID=1798224 RepID=UPI00087B2519|nr:sigma-E factor regulatory protein RseB domain-containing protein [Jiangella sp. DSM 45060]SDT53798.1 sigma E regulatory protein, MucB/RseB [Jiangella sp. DSM 45060]
MSLGYRVGHGRTGGLAALVVPVLAMPLIVGALAVFVQAVPASSRDVGDDPRAVQLLRQSAEAGEHVSYSGTQYVSTWSALTQSGAATSAVVQVQHAAGGQTSISLHDRQAAILDGRTTSRWLAGDDPADLLLGAYTVRLVGAESVAGRSTDIVVAYRGDGSVAAKLWLDRETALPLRRESYTSDGYTLSASAFVTIAVGTAAHCCKSGDGVGRAASTYDDAASMLRWDDIEQLREDGWHCPGSIGEGLDLYEARRVGDAIQLSYSDGVMTVSVFEQAGWLDPDQLDGYGTADYEGGVVYTRPGPPARLTWSSGGRVITVVAEAPLDAVRDLLKNLPPDPAATVEEKKDGFLDRISRGAQRVGSWFNPFD